MTPARARVCLGLIAVATIAGIVASARWVPPVWEQGHPGDADAYAAMVARMRTGESYYSAVGDELRKRGYATVEIFNWRTPLLMSTLARVGLRVGRAALVALGIIVLVASAGVLWTRSKVAFGLVIPAQLCTVVILSAPGSVVMGEAWAGAFIALSVCAYMRSKEMFGALLAIVALFIRELTAPYCVACTLIAARNRRWRELALWIAGALGYAVYYAVHIGYVFAHRQAGDVAHARSWFEIGGLPFLMGTVGWTSWLTVMPWWAAGVAFGLIVASLFDRSLGLQGRFAVGLYPLLFLVAGKSFDHYWGFVTAPTWSIAIACGVPQTAELIRSARGLPPAC